MTLWQLSLGIWLKSSSERSCADLTLYLIAWCRVGDLACIGKPQMDARHGEWSVQRCELSGVV